MKSNLTRRSILKAGAIGAAMIAAPGTLRAESWPARPVTFVLGSPPGGGLDTFARLLAPYLSKELGQPVQVENRTGASGNIATEYVVNAKPDGYTFLVGTASALSTASYAFKDLSFDPIEDLDHVSLLTESSYVVLVNKALPVKNWEEFVAYGKENPGKLIHACAGVGSANHLIGELLGLRAGFKFTTVQYRGGGPAITDLLADQANFAFISVGQSLPYISTGQLRGFLNCAPTRASELPDVPASAEFGLADVDKFLWWLSLSGPKGTPDEVQDIIYKAVVECFKNEDLTNRMKGGGFIPVGSTPAELNERVRADHALVGRVIEEAGLQLI